MIRKLPLLVGIVLMSLSCKKEVTTPNNGIYRGVFREIATNGDTLASGVTYLALNESNLVFTMSGDSVSNAPATHGGTYLIDNPSTMQFSNFSLIDTVYDIDHYLDTTYNYKFDDNNFKLWQIRYGKTYEYNLVRD